MAQKAIVYGVGNNCQRLWKGIQNDYSIVALADADSKKQGTYNGYKVISPQEITEKEFDLVLVTPNQYDDIVKILLKIGIHCKNILVLFAEGGNLFQTSYGAVLEDATMRCRFDDVCFDLKTISDRNTMSEIFLYSNWNFVPARKHCVVFDIGMNIGLASLFFASRTYVDSVYGFEPFPKTYQRAIENIRLNPADIKGKIHTYNVGLGKCKKNISAMYDECYTTNMRTDGIAIEMHGTPELVEDVHIENAGEFLSGIMGKISKDVSLILKIDCEGAEYEILETLQENSLLNQFSIIMMETHDGRENEAYRILRDNYWNFFARSDGEGQNTIYAVNDIGNVNTICKI